MSTSLANSDLKDAQLIDINGLNTFWAKAKKVLFENSPIGPGDAENSAVLKGEYDGYSNNAISKTSIALGGASNAGLKGWYYSGIDFTNNKIYLSKTQPNSIKTSGFTTDTSITLDDIQGPEEGLIIKKRTQYIAGDTLSIVCDSKYENKCKITAVEPGIITVDAIPFTSNDLPSYTLGIGKQPDDFTLYSIMPEVNSTTKQLTVRNWNQGGIDLGGASLAEGANTYAVNVGAHAEGLQTVAYGQYSHTEGFGTKAGYAAHAEGRDSEAKGLCSHAEGTSTQALNSNSHAEGFETEVRGYAGHGEGKGTKVLSDYGHSEGELTEVSANSNSAHAEGIRTKASNTAAHAEGRNTIASGVCSHAEGYNDDNNEDYGAFGAISHTEGYATVTTSTANSGHAEGRFTTVSGMGAHAEGISNTASGEATHVEGKYTKATGYAAHAEGYGESLEKPNLAQGDYSHVEGEKTQTLGMAAHAEGGSSIAKGNFSHSEGRFTRAHALCSHAEGFSVEGKEDEYGAFGPISHVEGYANITTSGANSAHAEGRLNTAMGMAAHVEGISNVAYGDYSHAEGNNTISENEAEHACGKYNKSTKSSNKSQATHFSIGIGTSDSDRKNAFEVKQNGDVYITGVEKPIQSELTELSEKVDNKQNVIADLENIRSGAKKGATALQSIPSEYITENELTAKGYATTAALNNKVDKISGKQLSTEDFTKAFKTKLEGLNNYDDTELSNAIETLRRDFDNIVSGDTTTAIKTFNEVIAFLDGLTDTQNLESIIASIEQQIAGKMDKVTLATVATTGSYNDLSNKPTIPDTVTESTVSGWGFTKNAGTITGIKMNGTSKGTSGVVDLGTVLTSHQDISGKADKNSLATVATSGSYNDLSNKPTIPSEYKGNYSTYSLSSTTTSFALSPNTYYTFSPSSASTRTFTFGSAVSGITNEYIIEIDMSSYAPSIALPSAVSWSNNIVPAYTVGKKYIISIVNNCAVFAEF